MTTPTHPPAHSAPTQAIWQILVLLALMGSFLVSAAPQQVNWTVGGDSVFTVADGQVILGTDQAGLGLLGTYADANFLCFGSGDGGTSSPAASGFFSVTAAAAGSDSPIQTYAAEAVLGAATGLVGFGSITSDFGAPWSPIGLADGNHYLGFLTTTGNYGWMEITLDNGGTVDSPGNDTITIVDSYVETTIGAPIGAGRTTAFPPNLVAVAFTAGGNNLITSADAGSNAMVATPATHGTLATYVDANFICIGDGNVSDAAAPSGVFSTGSLDIQSDAISYAAGTIISYPAGNLNYASLTSNAGGFPNLADGNHFIGFRTTNLNLGWMEVTVDSNATPGTTADDTITIVQAYVETQVGVSVEIGSTGGPSGPDIEVRGNGVSITNGDATPAVADDTDFGSANIGTSVTTVYTINNVGDADLNIPTFVTTGSDFGIVVGPPLVIAAAGSATFSVFFAPTSVATGITAIMSIVSDDADENPFTFTVEGEGTAAPVPDINLVGNGQNITSGDSVPSVLDDTDFGTIGEGFPVVRTFTIQNLGGVTLNVTNVSGFNADFAITGFTSGSIAGAASETFTITYTPNAVAIDIDIITIASDSPGETSYTFGITGTGVAAIPEINVTGNGQGIVNADATPDLADDTEFGLVTNGANPTATFTIENNGYNTLNVTGVTRSAGSTDYSITAGGGAAAIAIGGTSTFTVTYSAATIGATAATISIANDDADENPYTFDVGGTGQPAGPLVSVKGNGVVIANGDATPDVVDDTNFGTHGIGGSTARTYTITNAGDAMLNVSGITPGGAAAAKFAVSSISFPAAIAVGASDTFLVTYSPTISGTDNASLSIASDDATSPYVYSVAGIGVNVFDADDSGGGAANDGSGDAFLITQDGVGNLTVSVNGTIVTVLLPGEAITINGSPDDDTLTVDLGGGTMPEIYYNGTSGTDSLILTNANGTTMTYTPTTTTDGTLAIDGNVLTFTGLSPITQTGTIADVVIDTTAPGAQTIYIDATATDTTVDANGGFELITFANATNSFSLNAGDGDDTIRLNTFAASTPTINIDGQDGDDTINMPFSAAGAGLTFNVSGSSHTAGDTFNFDPEGNGITVNVATITGTPATINFATIETVNTVGEIDVVGNSNSITDGDVTPSPADHSDFGNAVVGLTNVTRTFTITNTGAASINVTVPITITGTGSAQFSVSVQPGALVAAVEGSTTFNVLFTPATTATYTAQVNITNDDADENPYTFAIQGIGDAPPSTIPTLGEWGMVILCLLMGSFGLAYMRKESLATAGGSAQMSTSPSMPFDQGLFKRCLLVFAGITIAGFAASAAVIGHVQLSDAVGGPICAAVAAYFAHLVILMKREQG